MKQITTMMSNKLELANDLRALDLKVIFMSEVYEIMTNEFLDVFSVIDNLPRQNRA